jgi:hypothetical protein
MQFPTRCLDPPLEGGFYWERLALAVEIFRKHLSLLQLNPPRSALDLTNFATEVMSNLRTNAESLHITAVILELTQFWVATS